MFTCAEVAAYYRESALRCETELSGIVATVVATAAENSRSYIGNQQPGFPPLSSATTAGFYHPLAGYLPGKEERGFAGPDFEPLRGENGDLYDSIESSSERLTGISGSTSKVGLYQEMGTPGALYPIPPRPFLAKGMMEAEPEIEPLTGELAVSLLVPRA